MRRLLITGRKLRGLSIVVALCAALALATASGAKAARLTVCQSGCQYTTIQAALAAASNGDTIAVGPGTYEGEFTIDVSIRLVGAGQGATTITGPGLDGPQVGPPVVTILSGTTVAIRQVTISGGASEFAAGGIDNLGNLTLTRSTLERNGGAQGGAIHNYPGATATIFRSTISRNVAGSFGSNPCCGFGGGIYNEGTLDVAKTAVTENISGGDVGEGGGILNVAGAMTLTDSRVAGNTVDGFFGAGGGGIANIAKMTLRRTPVTGNTARAGDGFAYGGGIANGSAGTMTLIRSPVTGNAAVGSPLYGSSGGGIFNSYGGLLTLVRSSVTGNMPDDCVGC